MADGRMRVIRRGDDSGNNMIVRLELSSGRDIFGLATQNLYGGDWDVGPTWNYLISGDRPFLVDSGRWGQGGTLLEMVEAAGFGAADLAYVAITHGHEDHDGGLAELTEVSRMGVLAHEIYSGLVKANPTEAPSPEMADFPASCWSCPMPKSFYTGNCLDYHSGRKNLQPGNIEEYLSELGPGITVFHTPGHSPDAIAIVVDDEAMLVGDTVLPDITPHPTRESFFHVARPALPAAYVEPDAIYGLRAYLRSLKKLGALGAGLEISEYLPGHRLFTRGQWSPIDLEPRLDELIRHHVDRCAAILKILENGPMTAREISIEYFEPGLLKGVGIRLAINEVLSHCELLELCNDALLVDEERVAATGTGNFESLINELGR